MGVSKEDRASHYAKKYAENKKNGGGGGNFERPTYFKLSEGLNRVRLIPAHGDRIEFHTEVLQSWGCSPTNSYKGPIIRGDQFGKEDPVAEEIARLEAIGDEASKKRAHRMRATKSLGCFIIDRDHVDKGVQFYSLNWSVYNEICALFADSDYGDITCPETGVDLKITYTPGVKKPGGGWIKKPEHNVIPARESSPLNYPEALAECLFTKYRIEEPTEAEFARHVLAGTEQEYIAQRKAEREAEKAPEAPQVSEDQVPFDQGEETPQHSQGATDKAVQAELDRIKAEAEAPAPPPPAPAPSSGTPIELLEDEYWIVQNGQTVAASGNKVQLLVNDGQTEISCRSKSAQDWSNPTKIGFIPETARSQVGKDLEEALK